MNVLKRCCYRSLKENSKRTAVTIVGVVLATALITAVACMMVSLRVSMLAYEKKQNGDWHYYFQQVAPEDLKYFQNNQYIEKMGLAQKIGYAVLDGSKNADKPYIYLQAIDEECEGALSLQLVDGRMPENDSELVIGGHIRSNGLVEAKVGDVLTLAVGDRISEGHQLGQNNAYLYDEEDIQPVFEKNYTVVGIVERPNYATEPRTAPGYSAFTILEDVSETDKVDVYVSYTSWGLRHEERVTSGILGVSEELYHRYKSSLNYTEEEEQQIRNVADDVVENYWMVKWENLSFSSGTMNMLYAMAVLAILVIIITSVFCIRNSFVISLTEKMKMYGRLASIGTTSGQQKKIIYYEAAFLGSVGIPLGIACGLAAAWILVYLVGGMVEDALGIRLVFGMSLWAVLTAVVLSVVTIYFSASKSAKKAARLSPITAIRAGDTVKMSRRGLRCPKMVGRCFGIGGVIAYKNLKRAKVKYRTTVISIVVSVAVFIGMTTFTSLLFFASGVYYEDMEYQLRVSTIDSDGYEKALRIRNLEGIQEMEIVRSASFITDGTRIPFTEGYFEHYGEAEERESVLVYALGDEAYSRYLRLLGVSEREALDKAIVIADYRIQMWSDGKRYLDEGNTVEYSRGDVIRGVEDCAGIEIEVLSQTSVRPMSLADSYYAGVMLVVSDKWYESQSMLHKHDNLEVYIQCENPDETEKMIRGDMGLLNYSVNNYDAEYRSNRSLQLVIGIFLYGFITVVALIGITNIFNTVTTNMELRAPEFAICKSIGMTRKEFKRMIWLEGVFYGGKALLIGIPLGVLISYGFHRAFSEGIVTKYTLPWQGIFIAAAAVVALLYGIMNYSMGKINHRNIIETIRSENI